MDHDVHAAEGDFEAALRVASGVASMTDGTNPHAVEGAYLAVVAAVSRPAEIDHAVAALRGMLHAGVAPTLRTRVAIARMAARSQRHQLKAMRRLSIEAEQRAQYALDVAQHGAGGPLLEQARAPWRRS